MNTSLQSLPTLLKRLEAATMRLEDIAMAQAPLAGHSAALATSGAGHDTAAATASSGVDAGAGAVAASSHSAASATSPAVQGYQELIDGPLSAFMSLSQQLGGLVAEQAKAVHAGFEAQRDFVQLASNCKPISQSSPSYLEALGPTQKALVQVIELKDKNRGSKEISFLNTVAEGIPALGWVTIDKKPAPHVNDSKDAAQFWANRVVKDNKDINPTAIEWARGFIAVLEGLRKYIMQYHTTGLVWNSKGVDYAQYNHNAGSAPPPPPPPPPPPAAPPAPNVSAAAPATSSSAPGDMSGVFAALNQGSAVTSGLKKVDKSEMTHKNPELRASSVVPAGPSTSPKGPTKPPKPQSFQKKPPKTQLDGKVWLIENHENNANIVIADTELNHVVNVFNVKASVIQIKGKINAVSLVNCAKVSVLLDSTVSSLAVSSSPGFTVQILGKVPTILIDGTDGGQIYLSKESLDVEIVTAKCSAINVSLPVEGEEEGVYTEKAVPEQLKTVIKGGALVTSVVEHSG